MIQYAYCVCGFSVLHNVVIVCDVCIVVIWFAGLRGATSFALSLNMPPQHRDVYVTTTLAIIIITTFICGGLTEKVLTITNMKIPENDVSGIYLFIWLLVDSPHMLSIVVHGTYMTGVCVSMLEYNCIIIWLCGTVL